MSETAKALWWEAVNVFMKTNRWLFRKPFQFSFILISVGKQDTLERALWACTYCPKSPESRRQRGEECTRGVRGEGRGGEGAWLCHALAAGMDQETEGEQLKQWRWLFPSIQASIHSEYSLWQLSTGQPLDERLRGTQRWVRWGCRRFLCVKIHIHKGNRDHDIRWSTAKVKTKSCRVHRKARLAQSQNCVTIVITAGIILTITTACMCQPVCPKYHWLSARVCPRCWGYSSCDRQGPDLLELTGWQESRKQGNRPNHSRHWRCNEGIWKDRGECNWSRRLLSGEEFIYNLNNVTWKWKTDFNRRGRLYWDPDDG